MGDLEEAEWLARELEGRTEDLVKEVEEMTVEFGGKFEWVEELVGELKETVEDLDTFLIHLCSEHSIFLS